VSNTYFDHRTSIARLVRRSMAKSTDVNALLDSVSVGFDGAEASDLRSIRGPVGEAMSDLPAAAVRASMSLVFDSAGNPAVSTIATTDEMIAAVAAATVAFDSAAAAAADAATLASAVNAIALMQLQTGVI
jgi:hypothetical protein